MTISNLKLAVQFLNEGAQTVFVEEADELINLLAILKGDDGRDSLDATVHGEVGQHVDVHDSLVSTLFNFLRP